MKSDNFHVDLNRLFMSDAVEARENVLGLMVVWKRVYLRDAFFWHLEKHFTNITNAIYRI